MKRAVQCLLAVGVAVHLVPYATAGARVMPMIAGDGNTAPTCTAQEATTEHLVAKAIALSCSDADSDPLTVSVTNSPGHGSLTGTPPNVTYHPLADYAGDDSFKFQASDGTAVSDPTTVTVHVTDAAPTCDTGAATIKHDSGPVTVHLSCSDPDGDPLTYTMNGSAQHGTIDATNINSADHSVVYTPAAGYAGGDGFSFKASDGPPLGYANGSAGIEVTNVVPVCAPESVQVSTEHDTPVDIPIDCSDADGDPVTISMDLEPSLGSVDLSHANDPSPKVVYTPAAHHAGSVVFRIVPSDPIDSGYPESVQVDVVNADPVCTSPAAPFSHNTAEPISCTDPDGDPLTLSVLAAPSHGTLNAAALAAPAPQVIYTANARYAGPDDFRIKATDGVQYDAPRYLNNLVQVTTTDALPACTVPVATTGPATPTTIPVTCSDPDGDPVSVSASADYQPRAGTLTASAPGAPPAVIYTPRAGFAGTDSFVALVSDGIRSAAVPGVVTVTGASGAVSAPGSAAHAALLTAAKKALAATPKQKGTTISFGKVGATGCPTGCTATIVLKSRSVVVGKSTIRVPKGKSAVLKVKLNSKGRKLAAKGPLKATAALTLVSPGGAKAKASRAVKIKKR